MPVNLVGLPTDIILCINFHAEPTSSLKLVQVSSLVSVSLLLPRPYSTHSQTCKSLHSLTSTTVFWLTLAASTRRYRPVPTQGTDSLETIRRAVLTALNLHNAWVANGEFSIRKSRLFQAIQVPCNDSPNSTWVPWIRLDTEGQIFLHTDMPNRLSIRSIENGLVLWTIHSAGVVEMFTSAKLENRNFILAYVRYAGENA